MQKFDNLKAASKVNACMLTFKRGLPLLERARIHFVTCPCVVFLCYFHCVDAIFFIPSMEGDTGAGGSAEELGGSSFVVGLVDLFTTGAENCKTNTFFDVHAKSKPQIFMSGSLL